MSDGFGFGPGQWFVVRSRAEWARQYHEAAEAVKAKNGGEDPPTLRESHRIDPWAFSLMVEALVALDVAVDDEMVDLAGLHDVGSFW
ncbi:MAG TPA: hypothetical protein VH136_18570 [Trebonia sp.]|jgi:hypothetical protein|nr:hypothetical protein [Trebonia sp.]